MPTITLKRKRLLGLVGKPIDNEELSYAISMIGTDLEEINNENIIVEVSPNRPDMLSEEGFARALRYFLELEDEIKQYKVNHEDTYYAEINKKALKPRPYIAGAIVKNVKDFDEEAFESIINLQEKLHVTHGRKRKVASIGVHDLRKIEFPLKYTCVDENFKFTPLGWEREGSVKEILREHEKGKEYGHLLNEGIYPVWIDNKGDVLALPPIINGCVTAISPETRNFFIDVTGTNERVVNEILNIVVTHLVELGGEVYSFRVGNSEYPDLSYKRKKVNLDYVNSLLGLNLNMNYIEELLLKMGLGFEKIDNKNFYALVPPYRTDILHPIDIVEDIGIAYGYDKFEPELPNIFTIASLSDETKFEDILRDTFIGMGAIEVLSYHLSNEKILHENMGIKNKTCIKVIHPMNEEYNALRDSIIPLLLEFLSKNKRYEYKQFIFEIGNVFYKKDGDAKEEKHLAWACADTKASYEDAKAIVDALMRELGLTYKVEEEKCPFYIEGRCAKIIINDKEIGHFGEIHPQIIRNFDLEVPIIGGEMDVRGLQEEIKK